MRPKVLLLMLANCALPTKIERLITLNASARIWNFRPSLMRMLLLIEASQVEVHGTDQEVALHVARLSGTNVEEDLSGKGFRTRQRVITQRGNARSRTGRTRCNNALLALRQVKVNDIGIS